jgi:hypothetical protein
VGGKLVEGFAGVPGVDRPREDGGGFGRRLRQVDVVAQACVGKTPSLEMTGEGEHRLRKLEVSLRQRVRGKPCEIRRAIIAGIEPIGFGLLKAGNHGLGACVLDALVEPERGEVSPLIEFLDSRFLVLAGKNLVRGCGQQVANLFCHDPVCGIERSERIACRSLLGYGRRGGWPCGIGVDARRGRFSRGNCRRGRCLGRG